MNATTNQMTIDEMMKVVDPMSGKNRAERRRLSRVLAKQADYAKSGFVDRVRYVGSQPPQEVDLNGNPIHGPFSSEQLHQRAVARQNRLHAMFKAAAAVMSKNALVRMFDSRAPHANRSTADRKHFDRGPARKLAREAYEAGLKKPQPLRYLHSSAKWRAIQEAAPLLMAA